jgi:hypothetical protein
MRTQPISDSRHQEARYRQRLLGAAGLWLLGGSFMLITTLVPVYTELLGWTPVFWLVAAPLIVLLAVEPSLPRQLLALRRPRQPSLRMVMWH